jgi:predicted RNA binding protein YcfA (HicA-like mRNA interferase family)
MKLPRNVGGKTLCKALEKYDYKTIRQTGSHVRLSSSQKSNDHHITIPLHSPIKIGTLNQILSDISVYLEMDKNELIKKLFG